MTQLVMGTSFLPSSVTNSKCVLGKDMKKLFLMNKSEKSQGYSWKPLKSQGKVRQEVMQLLLKILTLHI